MGLFHFRAPGFSFPSIQPQDVKKEFIALYAQLRGFVASLNATTIEDGTYTPRAINTLNVDTVAFPSVRYVRIGQCVMVQGTAVIDATAAAGTVTQVQFTLPVAANFNMISQISGVCAMSLVNSAGRVRATTGSTGLADLVYLSQTAAAASIAFDFSYRVPQND